MKVELHCHSNYSDGIPSVESIIKKAETCVDAIAITDHNTFAGYERAKKIMEKSDLLLIPGVEVTASFNGKAAHATVIGAEELRFEKFIDIIDLIENAHATGGIAINVHPFGGFFRPGFTEKDVVKKFDAVEVLNGMTYSRFNRKALLLAKKLKMNMVSGSDAHVLQILGEFSCEIKGDSIDEILKSIKKGHVIVPNKKTAPARIFASQVGRKIYTKLRFKKR